MHPLLLFPETLHENESLKNIFNEKATLALSIIAEVFLSQFLVLTQEFPILSGALLSYC